MSANYMADRAKWAQLDIFNQMGNIYSEVGRSLKSSGVDREQAMIRAIDLFDATAELLAKRKSPQLKEVLRAKEEYLKLVTATEPQHDDRCGLDNYFLPFAVAARLHSGS